MMSKIRGAMPDDLDAVRDIVRAAYSHYIARIGRRPGPMLDDYAALVSEGRVHVVERDGIVRGLAVLIPKDEVMLFDNLAVAPEAQRSGLGRQLMDFAERAAIAAGYSTIELYTNEAMTENIARYVQVGYVETHRAEEKGLRRVYMRKTLSTS